MVSLTAASVELLFVSVLFSVLLEFGLCRRVPASGKRSGQHQEHKGECRPSDTELHSWGRWASHANHTTRHLSLLSPVLPEMELRSIGGSELPHNPVLAGDDACPARLNQLQGDPLMVRSLCPWYWRINYDPLRLVNADTTTILSLPLSFSLLYSNSSITIIHSNLSIKMHLYKLSNKRESISSNVLS